MKTDSLVRPPESRSMKSYRIVLSPGEEVGEHTTERKEEIIIVLKGKATIIRENERFKVKERELHYIGEGIGHNVKNETNEPLEYVYVVNLLDEFYFQ